MNTYQSPNHKVSLNSSARRPPDATERRIFNIAVIALIVLFVMTVPVGDHIDRVIEFNERSSCN